MIRSTFAIAVICVAAACGSTSEPAPETVVKAPLPAMFAGQWRCVTPSDEFIRLSITSKSSEMGVFAAQLMMSGVIWEGAGRIEGDSLALSMTLDGGATSGGAMVARATEAQTLRFRIKPSGEQPTDLTFVREN